MVANMYITFVDSGSWGPHIIFHVILYLIFLGSRSAVIIIVFVLVIILNRLGIVGIVGDGVVKVGDILLVILVIVGVVGDGVVIVGIVGNGVVKVGDILLVILVNALLVRWVWGLLACQPGVSPGAGNTVHTKDAVEIANYLGLEMDGALDSAFGDALDRLFDTADSTDIVAKERHPCYLDIPERDSHLVDEVEVHKVGISVGNLGPTRDCKWDLFANKREIRTFWNIYLVCSNCHRIVEVGVHQVVLLGIRLRLLHKGTGVFDQDDLAATKTDVRCVGSVVNFHNRTKRHIDLYETEL